MTPEAAQRAANLLLLARRACRPIARLPEDCAPANLADAYRIQAAVVAEGAGARIAGFKIGATSQAAQTFLGLDEPFVGCMPDNGILSSPARISRAGLNFCLIEPEFAVRLDRDLAPRDGGYRRADVAEAVAGVYPAIEVVTSAYGEAWRTVGAPHLIADNGVHGCLVLGPERTAWRDLDLGAQAVVLTRNGREEGRGTGANALGHPLDALAWLAGQGAAEGRGLKAGDIVTTGVVTPFIYVAAGDDLSADFGPLGEVRLQIVP